LSGILFSGDSSTQLLCEELRPNNIKDLIGNSRAIGSLCQWLKLWKNNPRKILETQRLALLVGPPGCGKTTTAKVCPENFGYESTILNASEMRLTELKNYVVMLSKSPQTTFGKTRCIVLDEIDGIHRKCENEQFDNIEWFIKLIKNQKRKVPIIATCNERWGKQMKRICQVAKIFYFNCLQFSEIQLIYNKICAAKPEFMRKMTITRLNDLIGSSNGDARAFLNELYFETMIKENKKTEETRSIELRNQRGRSIFEHLRSSFCKSSVQDVRYLFQSVDFNLAILLLWHNLPNAISATYSIQNSPDLEKMRIIANIEETLSLSSIKDCDCDETFQQSLVELSLFNYLPLSSKPQVSWPHEFFQNRHQHQHNIRRREYEIPGSLGGETWKKITVEK
jgi:DNA polymerase III delta prime subunit